MHILIDIKFDKMALKIMIHIPDDLLKQKEVSSSPLILFLLLLINFVLRLLLYSKVDECLMHWPG